MPAGQRARSQPGTPGSGMFVDRATATAVVETHAATSVELGPGDSSSASVALMSDGRRPARARVQREDRSCAASRSTAPSSGRWSPSDRRARSARCARSPRPPGRDRRQSGDSCGQAQWAVFSPAVENLVAQLTRLPGRRARARRSGSRSTSSSGRRTRRSRSPRAIEEVKERVRFCRECGNLTEEEVCAICRDARRDHTIDLRRRAARRPDLARADARVPRPLPRARRRALAARRRRAGAPAHRRAAPARRAQRRRRRSCSRRTRT